MKINKKRPGLAHLEFMSWLDFNPIFYPSNWKKGVGPYHQCEQVFIDPTGKKLLPPITKTIRKQSTALPN